MSSILLWGKSRTAEVRVRTETMKFGPDLGDDTLGRESLTGEGGTGSLRFAVRMFLFGST